MVLQDDKYAFPRDLIGYGQEGKNAEWPGGARIAVSICLNYEEGAESTLLNGDVQSESINWEKGAHQDHRPLDYVTP
ncbi:hypothetical protein VTK73DRAFT_1991 [Phialemonium thermophilum]|uniref:Uncharacterized protein n=1 Tax=Phialemonium thermophilum TaxID=223376 RepID=A0ABR3VSS4_9PEZI